MHAMHVNMPAASMWIRWITNQLKVMNRPRLLTWLTTWLSTWLITWLSTGLTWCSACIRFVGYIHIINTGGPSLSLYPGNVTPVLISFGLVEPNSGPWLETDDIVMLMLDRCLSVYIVPLLLCADQGSKQEVYVPHVIGFGETFGSFPGRFYKNIGWNCMTDQYSMLQ